MLPALALWFDSAWLEVRISRLWFGYKTEDSNICLVVEGNERGNDPICVVPPHRPKRQMIHNTQ